MELQLFHLVSNGQHLVDPPSPLHSACRAPFSPKVDMICGVPLRWMPNALCHEIGRIFSLLTDDEKVQSIFLCIISESQGDRLSVISVGGIG